MIGRLGGGQFCAQQDVNVILRRLVEAVEESDIVQLALIVRQNVPILQGDCQMGVVYYVACIPISP